MKNPVIIWQKPEYKKFGFALDFSNIIEIQHLRYCRESVLYQTIALLFMFDF